MGRSRNGGQNGPRPISWPRAELVPWGDALPAVPSGRTMQGARPADPVSGVCSRYDDRPAFQNSERRGGLLCLPVKAGRLSEKSR